MSAARPRTLVPLLVAGFLAVGPAVPVGAQESARESAGAAEPAGPEVDVREGYVVNFRHRCYYPLSDTWILSGEATGDFQVLRHTRLSGVTVKVLVAEGSRGKLPEMMDALRRQAAEDGRTHVLQEGRRRLGVREAGELLMIRRGAGGSNLGLVMKTIAFRRHANNFYLRLEAPVEHFERANDDFNGLAERFRFEFRLPFLGGD